MERRTFFMRSFWTILAGVAMFIAAFGPDWQTGKMIGYGLDWVAVILVALRFRLADNFSWDETRPDPKDGEKQIKTGRTIRPHEEFTERLVIVLATFAALIALLNFEGRWLTSILTWSLTTTVVAVATRRAVDEERRDVSDTQLHVFYAVPVIVALALFAAFLGGLNIWVVIGGAVLTAAWHLRYGYVLDSVERAAISNVVPINTKTA